jgi:hypothetical protein
MVLFANAAAACLAAGAAAVEGHAAHIQCAGRHCSNQGCCIHLLLLLLQGI